MDIAAFTTKLQSTPTFVSFDDTMQVIEAHYVFSPTAFRNGDLRNDEGQNSGSCKLFAFAKDQGFSPEETLQCFGDYYRKDVLENPNGTDHQNIRNFIQHGWEGIHFDGVALVGR
ncbi:HopJ type III effector protein [Reichenbachiella carrageenanivorans]|uniref:HopJ type III effector protein n=1 Tax=Reichenbachiella carrageenanivorans TaxID=2979869 RepID=A0ABY6CWZ8_9BACT|nr:HopJ type III effector protein [Reichenbachiella carrageenanivorans]UXX78451.1 HopJ type III effector protein [Reichenbachiella carrageenanivorans]